MGGECDLTEFDHGMAVGATQADLLQFSHTRDSRVYLEKI